MTKYLIVNADDYGLCREISEGILIAHEKGIVTTTSVVSVGAYFEKGLEALKQSRIDTGIHLTFVGEEKALSGPIEGLTTHDGRFFKGYRAVIPVIISGRYHRQAFERELFMQTEKMADHGLSITHINAHQHLHMLPSVFNLVLSISRKFHIRWFRNTASARLSVSGSGLKILGILIKGFSRKGSLKCAHRNIGFDTSGFMDENHLLQMIRRMKDGITELIAHPGWNASASYDWGYRWEDELGALTSPAVFDLIHQKHIILTDYQKLT